MFRQMLLHPDPGIKSSCQAQRRFKSCTYKPNRSLRVSVLGPGASLSIDHINHPSVLLKLNVFLSDGGCGASSLSANVCPERRRLVLCAGQMLRHPRIKCSGRSRLNGKSQRGTVPGDHDDKRKMKGWDVRLGWPGSLTPGLWPRNFSGEQSAAHGCQKTPAERISS